MTVQQAGSVPAEFLVLAAADDVLPALAAEPDADRRRDRLVLAALDGRGGPRRRRRGPALWPTGTAGCCSRPRG